MHNAATDRRFQGPRFSPDCMSALELSRDLVCMCDDGVIVDINSAGLTLLGLSQVADVKDMPFASLVAADYQAAVDDLLRLKLVEVAAFPVLLLRRGGGGGGGGGGAEVELLIHPARDLGPNHTIVTAHDISRQGQLARTARNAEDRFRLLVENGMHLIARIRGGRIIYMNRAGFELLGASSRDQLDDMPAEQMFYGAYREVFSGNLSALLEESGVIPVQLARFDGQVVDAQMSVTALPWAGEMPEFMIEARDVTAHNRAVAALRQMNDTLEHKVSQRTQEVEAQRLCAIEARLFAESLIEAMPNPLWWKDQDGRFQGYNRAFRDIFAIGPADWLGRPMHSLLDPAFVALSAQANTQALAGTPRVQFEAHLNYADELGHDVVVTKTAWGGGEGRAEGVIGMMLDITERKRMEAELRRLATTDPLTGVFNRRCFMETGGEEVVRARRYGRPLTVLMLDVDHFKRINDTFGHPVGDEALKALTAACYGALRPMDSLGRLGGEEFAIILPETALPGAMVVAERLRAIVGQVVIPAGQTDVSFTVSIGVTEMRASDVAVDNMLSRADLALYAAKASGRNRVVESA